MRKFVRALGLMATVPAFVGLVACGGSSSPSTPTPTPAPTPAPTPTPPPPGGSACTNVLAAVVWKSTEASPAAGFATRITFIVQMEESGGTGANMDLARADLFRAGGGTPDESPSLPPEQIAAQTGSSRLEAGQTRDFELFFDSTLDEVLAAVVSFTLTPDGGSQCQVDGGSHDTV